MTYAFLPRSGIPISRVKYCTNACVETEGFRPLLGRVEGGPLRLLHLSTIGPTPAPRAPPELPTKMRHGAEDVGEPGTVENPWKCPVTSFHTTTYARIPRWNAVSRRCPSASVSGRPGGLPCGPSAPQRPGPRPPASALCGRRRARSSDRGHRRSRRRRPASAS